MSDESQTNKFDRDSALDELADHQLRPSANSSTGTN
jgi:hypothetical protein